MFLKGPVKHDGRHLKISVTSLAMSRILYMAGAEVFLFYFYFSRKTKGYLGSHPSVRTHSDLPQKLLPGQPWRGHTWAGAPWRAASLAGLRCVRPSVRPSLAQLSDAAVSPGPPRRPPSAGAASPCPASAPGAWKTSRCSRPSGKPTRGATSFTWWTRGLK